MRLLLGLILWVGTPFYLVESIAGGTFDPLTGGIMVVLAVGLAIGEYTRYTARERRKAMQRAQERAWTGR